VSIAVLGHDPGGVRSLPRRPLTMIDPFCLCKRHLSGQRPGSLSNHSAQQSEIFLARQPHHARKRQSKRLSPPLAKSAKQVRSRTPDLITSKVRHLPGKTIPPLIHLNAGTSLYTCPALPTHHHGCGDHTATTCSSVECGGNVVARARYGGQPPTFRFQVKPTSLPRRARYLRVPASCSTPLGMSFSTSEVLALPVK